MKTMTARLEQDNESITLLVETTAAASGFDPSTDGSADPGQPVRFVQTSTRTSERGRVRTRYAVEALGINLDSRLGPIDLDTPRWLPCRDVPYNVLRDAMNRVTPWAEELGWAAEAQLELEDGTANDDEWLTALERRSNVEELARSFGVAVPA